MTQVDRLLARVTGNKRPVFSVCNNLASEQLQEEEARLQALNPYKEVVIINVVPRGSIPPAGACVA